MIGRRKKDLPKWRYDFNCRKCDNVQFINDPEHGRLDDWWWLVTPYAGYAGRARIVYTGGSLDFNGACYGDSGVRPAFFAESGIILESDGGEAVEAFDQGRPDPIHADDDRVVRCDCFRPIPEEQKEGEGT